MIPLEGLKKYINQPYPYYYSGKKLIEISFVLITLAFIFNYFVQPFEMNKTELKLSFFWVALIHSISPLLAIIPVAIIFTKSHSSIENWKIRDELFVIFTMLFLTGSVQFLLRDILYNNPNNWSWLYFYEEITNTLLIGSLLASIVVSINLNLQFLKNNEQASAFNLKLKEKKLEIINSEIIIETELKSEAFKLKIQDFVFAKSEGNYVEIWIVDDSLVKPLLKRIKLKDLESFLHNFQNIIRTHRSFLLNKNYIENISGNAQGYKINLKNCKELVPVSRNYLNSFNTQMNL